MTVAWLSKPSHFASQMNFCSTGKPVSVLYTVAVGGSSVPPPTDLAGCLAAGRVVGRDRLCGLWLHCRRGFRSLRSARRAGCRRRRASQGVLAALWLRAVSPAPPCRAGWRSRGCWRRRHQVGFLQGVIDGLGGAGVAAFRFAAGRLRSVGRPTSFVGDAGGQFESLWVQRSFRSAFAGSSRIRFWSCAGRRRCLRPGCSLRSSRVSAGAAWSRCQASSGHRPSSCAGGLLLVSPDSSRTWCSGPHSSSIWVPSAL